MPWICLIRLAHLDMTVRRQIALELLDCLIATPYQPPLPISVSQIAHGFAPRVAGLVLRASARWASRHSKEQHGARGEPMPGRAPG